MKVYDNTKVRDYIKALEKAYLSIEPNTEIIDDIRHRGYIYIAFLRKGYDYCNDEFIFFNQFGNLGIISKDKTINKVLEKVTEYMVINFSGPIGEIGVALVNKYSSESFEFED